MVAINLEINVLVMVAISIEYRQYISVCELFLNNYSCTAVRRLILVLWGGEFIYGFLNLKAKLNLKQL